MTDEFQIEPPPDDIQQLAHWVDRIATQFDEAWQQDRQPQISDYVDRLTGEPRRQLLHALVVVDIEHRGQAGKSPSLDDYIVDFPQLVADDGSVDDEIVAAINEFESSVTKPESNIKLSCPHCRNPLVIVPGHSPELECPSCHSTLRLVGDNQLAKAKRLPKSLGQFQLLELVGQGAFGAVYRARDTKLGRTVAVKIPRSGMFATEEEERRFFVEAKSAAQLRHDCIVSVHEVGQREDVPYIVSDFIDGQTLSEYAREKTLTQEEAAKIVMQVADAIHHSHTNGIIHRDIKPGNILIDKNGQPHITDFGVALSQHGEITITWEGQVLGSPAYMSPEQASGKSHHVDSRSDVYSLGVLLYELITQQLPFKGDTAAKIVNRVLEDDPVPPRNLNKSVSRDLEKICLKAMTKDPKKRFATAHDMAADLHRFLAGEPVQARPAGNLAKKSARTVRTTLGILLLFLVAMFGLSVLGSVLMLIGQGVEGNYRDMPMMAGVASMIGLFTLLLLHVSITLLRRKKRRSRFPLLVLAAIPFTLVLILAFAIPLIAPRFTLQDDPAAVAALRERAMIGFKDNRVDSIDFYANPIYPLTDLDLIYVEGLFHVTSIDLGGEDISDRGLIHFKHLKNLEELKLIDTKVTDDGLAAVAQMANLRSLEIGGHPPQITDRGLSHLTSLTKLETLVIWSNEVTDQGLRHLESLESLRTLQIDSRRVTKAGIERLRKALPDCTIID